MLPKLFTSFVIFIELINSIMVYDKIGEQFNVLKARVRRSNATNAVVSRMETPNKKSSTSTQVSPNLDTTLSHPVNNCPSTTTNPKYKFIDSIQHPSMNRVQSTLTQIVDFSRKQAEANDSVVDSSDDNVSELSEDNKSKVIDLDEEQEVKFVQTEDNKVQFVKTSQEDNTLFTCTSVSVNTTEDVTDQQYEWYIQHSLQTEQQEQPI
jgi:hypothetical protein